MGRDPKHDYRSRCIYHITINKAAECSLFSSIRGSAERPVVIRSQIGGIVEANILNIRFLCPSLQVLQYVIMPDHIHFALFARDRLQYAIGSYIGMMKVKCGQQVRDVYPEIKAVFADDFHDRILRRYHKLDVIYNYIRQNPARWMLRQENPNFFRRKDNLEIDGQQWQAYGNMQLLDNPFKAPVVIHRADSKEILDAKKRRWAHLSENGGVLVSPFISAAEKEVRQYCEEVNGKLILLTNAPFADRQKPSAHDFMLCAKGQLLIIAPLKALAPGRETFLFLNSISEHIALNIDFLR